MQFDEEKRIGPKSYPLTEKKGSRIMEKCRLRKLDWKLTTTEPDILKMLCSIEETSIAIRENYISIYYCGEALYKVQKEKDGFKLSFNAGHFRYWNGNHGAMSKPKGWDDKKKPWEDVKDSKWDEAWNAIDEDLTPKIEENMRVFPYIKLNKKIKAYAEEAKQNFKEKKDAPSWNLTIMMRELDHAKAIVDDTTADGIVALQKKAIREFVQEKGREERAYAEKLMRNNRNLDFSSPTPGQLFFADCEYNLPDDEKNTLYGEAKKWQDKLIKEGKILGIGEPDGVGLLYCDEDKKWHPCLIEVKCGTSAYGGNSGIRKHMRDMVILASKKEQITNRLHEIEYAYQKLCEFTQESGGNHAYPSAQEINKKPAILFVLQCNNREAARKSLLKQLKNVNDAFGDSGGMIKDEWPDVRFVFTRQAEADDFASCYKTAVELKTLLAESR